MKKILRIKYNLNLSAQVNINVILSLLFRGISMSVAFVSVPLFLEIFSDTEYGLWLTIFTFLTWLSMFDFGLSQGLRNKLSEAIAKKDFSLAKTQIETTYLITFLWAVVFIVATMITAFSVGFEFIFNNEGVIQESVNNLMITVVIIFSMQFVSNNINGILHATQKSSYVVLIELISSLLNLSVLLLCVYYEISSLLFIAFCTLSSKLIVSLTVTYFSFKSLNRLYNIHLDFNFLQMRDLKKNIVNNISLIYLSSKFFLIQLSSIFLLNSANYLITVFFGSEKVVPFSIAYKIYINILFLYYLAITPYWSAFTEAYFKNDSKWMIQGLKKLLFIYANFAALVTGVFIFSGELVFIWLEDTVVIPKDINVGVYVYALIMGWNALFAYFLNGINLLASQFKIAIYHIVTNVPLCILLGVYFNMEIPGLIWATNINLLILSLVLPIQVLNIILKK